MESESVHPGAGDPTPSGNDAGPEGSAPPHFVPAGAPPRPNAPGAVSESPPVFIGAPLGGLPGDRPDGSPAEGPEGPERRGARSAGGWRTAVIGGVVGALVASMVLGALMLVAPRRQITEIRPADELRRDALDIGTLLELVRPSVVAVNTGEQTGEEMFASSGSGVVLSADGLVLTNAHVVSGAPSISVDLADGRTRSATLVGSFPERDVAVIQLQDLDKPVVPVELGRSADLKVGDEVVAIGNALGLGQDPSVTTGIVSATGRSIPGPRGKLVDLIQTDAAINPGNSGGPLLDVSGRLVGINTAFAANSQNIGFALEIDSVMPFVEDIESGDSPVTADSPFLGVRTQDVDGLPADVSATFDVEVDAGAFVVSVLPGSGAADGGLQKGDIIVEIDGRAVTSSKQVGDVVAASKAGKKLQVVFVRQGARQSAEVTVGRVGG